MTNKTSNVNYDEIFPPLKWEELPAALQDHRLREEVLEELKKDREAYLDFMLLPAQAQETYLEFCMGNRGLKITLDPFFKKIFNSASMDRLEALISNILGIKVTILSILSDSGSRMTSESALMFMDLLAMLEDGTLVNVEIQRVAHLFPMERAICYGSDLLVREYSMLRAQMGKSFSYNSMRPVYVIVLMEGPSKKFDQFPGNYVHRSPDNVIFDTGLTERNLQRYVFISLDIFRELPHNELNELDAWLTFLSSDDPAQIKRLIDAYPKFMEYYREIIQFRYHPKEVLGMTMTEAIGIMDDNAYKMMIDEMRDDLAQKQHNLKELQGTLLETQNDLEQTQNDLEQTQIDLTQTQNDLTQTKNDLTQTQHDLTQAQSDLTQTKNDLTQTKNDLTQTKNDLTQTQHDLTQAQSDLTQTKSDLTQAQTTLFETREDLQKSRDENAILRKLLEENGITIPNEAFDN